MGVGVTAGQEQALTHGAVQAILRFVQAAFAVAQTLQGKAKHASLTKAVEPLTQRVHAIQEAVREALADLLRHAVRVVQVTDVDRVICSLLQLPPGSLQGKSRAWAVSHPRMVAMYLARKHTTLSYGDIGTYFGGRNHSTVVAAEKKTRQWLEKNEELSLGERRVRVRELIERAERDLLR